jgi:G3E family GTPase
VNSIEAPEAPGHPIIANYLHYWRNRAVFANNIGEKRRSQLIFIGRNLDRGELNAGFKDCLA